MINSNDCGKMNTIMNDKKDTKEKNQIMAVNEPNPVIKPNVHLSFFKAKSADTACPGSAPTSVKKITEEFSALSGETFSSLAGTQTEIFAPFRNE